MAEDTIRQYDEGEGTTQEKLRRPFRHSEALKPRGSRRMLHRRPPEPMDYGTFKATFASAVAEIKLEIRDQHQQTRVEVQTVRRDVLAAVKASPTEYVKLACEFGILFLLFALAVRFVLQIELVNTAFALFMLPSLAVYWAMAQLKQHSASRDKDNQPS